MERSLASAGSEFESLSSAGSEFELYLCSACSESLCSACFESLSPTGFGSLSWTDSRTTNAQKDSPDVLPLDCNICYNAPPRRPVTTSCGHMFCWPCLYQWLQLDDPGQEKPCPVCRTMLRCNFNIFPVYGNNEGNSASDNGRAVLVAPNDVVRIPPRPQYVPPPSAVMELLGSNPGQFPSQSQVLAAIDVLLMVNRRLQVDRAAACDAQRAGLEAMNLELAELVATAQRHADDHSSHDPQLAQVDVDIMQDFMDRSQDALLEVQRTRHLLDETQKMGQYIVGIRNMVVQAHRELPSWWTSQELN